MYSTSILHKANVGWSLLVQGKVWWKEAVDEALHWWSKYHQQLKFAKRRNFWQLLVMWSLKLSFVAFVFMSFIMRTVVIHCWQRLLCGEVLSLVTFSMLWLFFHWSFDWSVKQWSLMEIKGHNWSKCKHTKLSGFFFFALGWKECFLRILWIAFYRRSSTPLRYVSP